MVKTDSVIIGQRNVTIKELTPKDLDQWFGANGKRDEYPSIFDLMYAEQLLPGDVVLRTTDLSADEMMAIPPHAMEDVVRKIKELNPFFMRMLESLKNRPHSVEQS